MLRGIEGLVQVALVAALQNEALLDILCAGFPRLYQLRDIKLCLGIADQAFCIISRSQRHSRVVPYAAPVPRGGCSLCLLSLLFKIEKTDYTNRYDRY